MSKWSLNTILKHLLLRVNELPIVIFFHWAILKGSFGGMPKPEFLSAAHTSESHIFWSKNLT